MKRILRTLLSALILASCAGESDPVISDFEEWQKRKDQEAAEGNCFLQLKAAEIEGMSVNWKAGDRVLVNGKDYAVTVLEDGTGRVQVKQAGSYDILYPSGCFDKGGSTLYLQSAQYYVTGSAGSGALPSSGSGSGDTITMNPLCGVLKFNVKGNAQIASIGIVDNSGGKLCGTYTVAGGALSSTDAISSSSVSLNCIAASGACASLKPSGTPFHVVVPAGSYSKGFTITISSKDHHSVRVDQSSAVTVKAGAVTVLPDIGFDPASDQLFAYHFDNLTLGGDPVGHNAGYGSADPSKPSAFDISLIPVSENTAGSACVTTTTTTRSCDLPADYMKNRGLSEFTLLQNVQEYHGYLGCGVNGNPMSDFKLPPFSCLGNGDICMAEVSLRIAAQSGFSDKDIDFLHSYSTSGKMLKMWLDGKLVADSTPKGTAEGGMGDASRWATSATADGVSTSSTFTIERIRVKAAELADGKWHDVKILLGAVTPCTVIEIVPHHSTSSPSTSAAFFIDDIVARRIPYESLDTPFPISVIVTPKLNSSQSSTPMTRLKAFGKYIGIDKYIDFVFGTGFFYQTNADGSYKMDSKGNYMLRPEADINSEIKEMADKWHSLGYKVWNIHLPCTTLDGSYDGTIFEYFHYDTATRLAAVDLTKKIMGYLKPLESRNLMAHATGPGRNSKDSRMYYINAKDYGVASFRTLVEFAASDEMRYSDGSHPVFCIENIQNTGTNENHVCAKPEYMNYYCEQVPGLKVCYDTSHGQVGSGLSSVEYLRKLGTNVCALHIHGSGKTDKDVHIFPGYCNGIYQKTGGDDIIDWGGIMDALVNDCHYSGPFTYEIGTFAEDHVCSFNNVVHNYYSTVLPAYKKK